VSIPATDIEDLAEEGGEEGQHNSRKHWRKAQFNHRVVSTLTRLKDSKDTVSTKPTELEKTAQALNKHSFTSSTPQKWGKHLSARIDSWAAALLPVFFCVYLALEFSGFFVYAATGQKQQGIELFSLGDFRVTSSGYANHSGIRVYTTDERDSSGETKCYANLQHLTQLDYDTKWRNLQHRQKTNYFQSGEVDHETSALSCRADYDP